MAKAFKDFRSGTITESPVDGVAKGSLEGDKHMCASKIMHKEWKEGKTIIGEHAEPVDAATPYSSNFMIKSSPLTPRNVR